MNTKTHCGFITIVGRPNVGKSTLLNKILGQKISITARKPQTTRHQILGIKTENNTQAVYVDTPGIHKHRGKALNRSMMRAVKNSLADVDVIIFMTDTLAWNEDDQQILAMIQKIQTPIILAVNKVDRIKDKKALLPFLQALDEKYQFTAMVPVSAKDGTNVDQLEQDVAKLLPENPFHFAEDQITDRSERFLVTEIIREKLTRLLGQELPHELTVAIESFKEKDKIINIAAVIYVERPGQKIIIIGKKGDKLKEVGTKARLDIEKLLGKKVYLQLWVKIKRGWSDDETMLQNLGYEK